MTLCDGWVGVVMDRWTGKSVGELRLPVGAPEPGAATTVAVAMALLPSKRTERQVYIRAPREGLPATPESGEAPPLRLMEALKGAYGLPETPRLWYLQARKLLEQAVFTELAASRATFRLASPTGEPVGFRTSHDDDGMIYGNPACKTFQSTLAQLNRLFNIKERHSLSADTGAQYLGPVWRQSAGGHTIAMNMGGCTAAVE